MTKKKEIIVFNKIDMINSEEIKKKIDIFNNKIKKKIYTISALEKKDIFEAITDLENKILKIKLTIDSKNK